MLWSPEEWEGAGVIEVYPAATQKTVTFKSAADALGIDLSPDDYANKDVHDALWCVVAGVHFLRGECHPPGDLALSQREGWIWFRQRVEASPP